jgi:AraC-like DNA-binding protein
MHLVTFLNTLILLGALQGFIVSALLWAAGRRRPEERTSKGLLAWLIFLIALACLNLYLSEQPAIISSWQWGLISAILPMVIVMPMGPLIYFYVRSCVEPGFRPGPREKRHYWLVVVDLAQHIAALFYVIGLIGGLISNRNHGFGLFLDYYDQYADIPRFLSLTIYLASATVYLKRQDKPPVWAWSFVKVLWAFVIVWLAFLIPYELPQYSNRLIDRLDWYPIYLPLVIIIYWLGIKGYFISFRSIEPPAGKKALLPEEKIRPVMLTLQRCMEEERLWLDPDLNVGKLAKHLGVAPKLLSVVLNQHMHTAFNEYVNGYRVNAVREKMQGPEGREMTIAGLAYECGFNSLPTFQRAFKASMGMTPKEYLASCDQIRN